MPGKDIPTIEWGTFFDEAGNPHVAPHILKYLMKGHNLSTQCPCNPDLRQGPSKTIIVHHVIH
jgi:hypothetical protein